MNRRNLLIVFVLLSAILLVSPLIGTVAAHNTDRHDDKCQKFAVAGSYSFPDTLNADHKYYPSEANQKKLVITQEENMLTYEITVGGITYKLGQDFTYSGHAVFTFYDPVYDLTLGPPLWPSGYSSNKVRIVYKYDFSAVPGGLYGTIRLIATLENGVLSIRSLGGTGDFRNVKIEATASSGFELPYTVTIFHDGFVSGWPCVVPATDTYQEVTYDQLTDLCLAAGLSKNPYPAPPISTNDFDPNTGVYHVYDGSAYYVLTMTIGDKAYQSIACNTYDATGNLYLGTEHIDYQTTHYFGALGKMKNGFAGVAAADVYGLDLNFMPTPDFYYTAMWNMHGFGHFKGQSLMLWQDTRESAIGTGYCVIRENWFR